MNDLKHHKNHRPFKATREGLPLVIQQLRKIVVENDIDQTQLAEAVGYDRHTLYFWWQGRALPRLRTLIDMAEALGYEVVLQPKSTARD